MNYMSRLAEEILVCSQEVLKIGEELQSFQTRRKEYESAVITLDQDIFSKYTNLKNIESRLYELRLSQVHVDEIYRVAKEQLPRLQKATELSQKDHQELEKWIGRAKGEDGLVDVINALKELVKYTPQKVKNVHALVQKIIIGGAFNRSKKG